MNILLIDLSSIGHAMWHVCANEPDPNAASTKTVERVRALASGQPHVAICLDSPPYFRMDIAPDYKAKRDKENNALVSHQIAVAADVLRADGFPLLGAQGYEADDIIATATRCAFLDASVVSESDWRVTIASADKDILQLVSDRVQVKSLKDGSLIGPDEVKAKLGVWPHQVVDYLSLVGDTSDNIQGAKKIGSVTAAKILDLFGNLEDVYRTIDDNGNVLTPAITQSLKDFGARLTTVRDLIQLRTDAPIAFDEVFKERVPVDVVTFGGEMSDEHTGELREDARETASAAAHRPEPTTEPAAVVREARPADIQRDGPDAARAGTARPVSFEEGLKASAVPLPPSAGTGVAVREPDIISAAPVEWERQLEPRSMGQAKQLAADLFASRLFSGYGNAPAVLSTIYIGRGLGLDAGASLRGFNIIDGRHAMTADLIRARCLSSPACEYFRIVERSAEKATWVTKRKGDPEVTLTYTISDGRQAWQKDQKAWDASAWGKRPANMVTKTASSELARLVYPDVVGGFYCPEELTGEDR